MSREIKFRIWDAHKNEFVNQPLSRRLAISCGGGIYTGLYDCVITEQFIAQQYTGLKDSIGKEIYEGDILAYEGGDWDRGQDGTDDRMEIIWDNKNCKFGINFWSKHGGEGYTGREHHLIDFLGGAKIIGNISENPELLA